MKRAILCSLGILAFSVVAAKAEGVAAALKEAKVVGDWQVEATCQLERNGQPTTLKATFAVSPPQVIAVTDEQHASLPMFDLQPHPFGWNRGETLVGVRAAGCTTRHALDPASVVVRAAAGAGGRVFQRGKDYEMDDVCGSLGRITNSAIQEQQAVFVSYRYAPLRIDSLVLTNQGTLALREGASHIATPLPPSLERGEFRLANIWVSGRLQKRLASDDLFPILETAYPDRQQSSAAAEALLPKTTKKLQDGQVVKILAWGDSVTECGWLPDKDRWQDQVVRGLKERFPKAEIELINQGWGGKNTELFLSAPVGNEHNYKEQILGKRPDLIVSEFINDVPLSPQQVDQRYGMLLKDFQAIGAEWIILTPHYCSPDGMGFSCQRQIDDDPRPYVQALRQFAPRNRVALADASLRYGRVWRQGLPYSTLLSNTINHPDRRGMAMLADSVLELFPQGNAGK